MTKYMLLIFGDEAQWEGKTPEQDQVHDAAHAAFATTAGAMIAGDAELEPSSMATTLRSDGTGGVLVTDGPFLETKEALGGFYLLDASGLDEVIKLASMLPEVRDNHSGVEIRPVVDRG